MYLSEEQMEALENALEALETSGGIALVEGSECDKSADVIVAMLESARKERRKRELIRMYKKQKGKT